MTNDYLLLIFQRLPLTQHSQCTARHMEYVKLYPPGYKFHVSKEVSLPKVRVSYLSPHPDTITAYFTSLS